MSENYNDQVIGSLDEYKYGFADEDTSVYKTGKGLTEAIVREISRIKEEPEWMTEFRVNAFHTFEKLPLPKWGPDLSEIDFNDYVYYIRPSDRLMSKSWDEVPDTIKDTFDRLGIPEAEKKFQIGRASCRERV